jgi:protein gp37
MEVSEKMTIHGLPGEKRNIEWSQESWNWMSGCEGPLADGVHCKGCYAKYIAVMRMRGRFGYPRDNPFRVVLHPDKLWGDNPTHLPAWTKQQTPMISGPFRRIPEHPMVRKKPTVFFNVSMGDWMYAERKWRREALRIMAISRQHIFVTLTKIYDLLYQIKADSPLMPDGVTPVNRQLALNLSKQIPKNVIVGISVTKKDQIRGIDKLREVPAFIRLVCFEPLLEDLSEDVDLTGIGWIIIGKRTRQGRTAEFQPDKIWVDKLIAKARELDIPVFLKPSMTGRRWYPEPIEETPYERIREELQTQTKIITPPPPGRMCGSAGIY